MESYLNSDIETLIPAGGFIEKYLKVINIKKKDFANYIDYDDSNLSALIRGRRKVNSDMAIKLGKIFSINPAIWLHIESKNELVKEARNKDKSYGKYSLEDLMKKAG
jgi:addiction module HigA family antidote